MTTAWYRKQRPTFGDTLAAVRQRFWREQGLVMSRHAGGVAQLRPALYEGLEYALCQAA